MVSVHPRSALIQRKPEWVVFQEAKRFYTFDNGTFMVMVTAADPGWLEDPTSPLQTLRQ